MMTSTRRSLHMKPIPTATRALQRGATLMVVLVLLLIMTVLGLAILRGTSLDERMSANLRDRSLSFQSAEAALREGETLAQNTGFATPAGNGCNGAGLCGIPVATNTDRWLDTAFAGWQAAATSMGALATPSSYIVEYMGMAPTWPGCDRKVPIDALCMAPRYRITARSQAVAANAGRAHVTLQTNYIVQ